MSAFKIFMMLSYESDGCISWYGSCLANMYGNLYHHVSLNSGDVFWETYSLLLTEYTLLLRVSAKHIGPWIVTVARQFHSRKNM